MPEPTNIFLSSLTRRRFASLAPLLALATACVMGAAPRPAAAPAEDEPTIAIVTRHMERAAEPGPDPSLDPAGVRRAKALATALEDSRVAAAIVTQYKRTRETAAPLAERRKLPVVERPVEAGKVEEYAQALAREIRATYAGRTVLVVGHSNTVPAIVAALSGRTIDPIPDDRYGDVYVVVMPPTGEPRLMQMRVQ